MAQHCRHLKELISTAWEHGCEQAKAQRHSKARAYMTAALNLMDFCESYKISKKVPARAIPLLFGLRKVCRECQCKFALRPY